MSLKFSNMLEMILMAQAPYRYLPILICILSVCFISTGQAQAPDIKAKYEKLCLEYSQNRMDDITAKRLCTCRRNQLTPEILPEFYEDLIANRPNTDLDKAKDKDNAKGTDSDMNLKLKQTYALQVIAPCQYLVFQSSVLSSCQQSKAMNVYKQYDENFCLCYAHERAIYMRKEMPGLIAQILAENPKVSDPFSRLYESEQYQSDVKKGISACL